MSKMFDPLPWEIFKTSIINNLQTVARKVFQMIKVISMGSVMGGMIK